MKLKLFGCPALRRELFLLASFSPHEIDVEILPAPSGAALLQDRIEETQGYDYILPCVGSRLSEGLSAAGIPLVIPRAHNCAHLLLGSLARYHRAFSENDDEPRWQREGECSEMSAAHGTPCTVTDTLFTGLVPAREGREYAADLSLLRDYLNGRWDARFLTVHPGERAVQDPVEILAAEPV